MITEIGLGSTPRTVCRLNRDWLFRPGVVGNAHEAFADDREWRVVQLPHDPAVHGRFSREDSTGANGWLPFGAGAYRKHVHLPEEAAGKRVLLEFEGVYRDAQVWVNGVYLGRELNGYLGFDYDVTDHTTPGTDNVVTVTYDNRTGGTSRWYTGEGIYRDVWLKMVDPLHVPHHGVWVTTPHVCDTEALVRIETDVTNLHPKQTTCRLVTTLMNPDGEPVAAAVAVAPIAADDTQTLCQELDVRVPRLWDVGAPNLYTARSDVYSDGVRVDSTSTRFGIRTLRMTPDQGLLLNGRKVVAKGGNLHHDLGCLGSAVLRSECERRLRQLAAIGCNSHRLSHNPHAPALLDVCDELGILVFNEAYDKWTSQFYGGDASFESQWERDLERFIRRDRNHPCVYIWSMGNEVLKQQGRHDPTFETREAAADYGVGLVRRMRAKARRLDPTRPVTVGLFPARAKFVKEWEHWHDPDTFRQTPPAEMAFHVDVVSWNYTENMFAADHARYPQLMFIASESACNLGFGNRLPSWREIDPRYVIGHYHWSAYDYLGESAWPTKVWGKALIDVSGWVTPLGRYYQSCYSDEPMVHIMVEETDDERWERFNNRGRGRWQWYPMADHWSWPGRGETKLTTFTNADEVELLLNGRSLGIKRSDGSPAKVVDWVVPYEAGTLTAVARTRGSVVAKHMLTTAGTPAAVELRPHRTTARADGNDIICVETVLADANGTSVPSRGPTISFSVSEAGVNAGVASGNIASDEPWQGDSRELWNGRCILLVRTGYTPGEIVVTAEADGFPAATCTITCE